LVASSPDQLGQDHGDRWDTGKIESDATRIVYTGAPLASGRAYFWKVCVWDGRGKARWSEVSTWSMGLLQAGDWHGRWIGLDQGVADPTSDDPDARRLAARYLRRPFAVSKPVKRATVYLCGLGSSELYINGDKIGTDVLSPALSEYEKRAYYRTYDVTAQLAQGDNAVGVILGNGRYLGPRSAGGDFKARSFGYPKLLLQMNIEYADGTTSEVVSGTDWKLTDQGPIRANNEYDGEDYDARMEMPGWATAKFDDTAWPMAQPVEPASPVLSAEMINPIRVMETVRPVAMTSPKPGCYVFNMGQNMVGWCRLKVNGPAGTVVTLRHAETLQPDGTLYVANLRTARAADHYTLKGGGEEIYEPRFTYHGFEYVELTGYPGTPSLDTIEGLVVSDDVPSDGHFSCSNALLNKIHQNMYWGTRGNYRSIPTDCPQRDERQGWLGDRLEESKGEAFMFDIAPLYQKWLRDLDDAQLPSGSICDVAPAYWPFYNDGVVWPSAFIVVPYTLYQQYGDIRFVQDHYDSRKKWIDYTAGFLQDGILEKNTYGDWCVPPETRHEIHTTNPALITSGALLSSAFFYHDLRLMEQMARLLGHAEDATHFGSMADQLKIAFNQRFYNPKLGCYDNGTQTSSVLPIAFGLVPDGEKARVFAHLVDKIVNGTHGHIGTGIIGGQYLMRVLSDNGRLDLVYAMATQTTYPSWGYMISRGATTIWELWNGDTADPAMNSRNHLMLIGDLNIWFYEYLGGIRPDPAAPGFRNIIIKPEMPDGLDWAKADYDSIRGRISSEWHQTGAQVDLKVTIPANSTATVTLPAKDAGSVTESGRPLAQATGIKSVRVEAGQVIADIGSGSYEFVVRR
jgi:alpha-L-rhamnosidase